jgi:hypothetical protein
MLQFIAHRLKDSVRGAAGLPIKRGARDHRDADQRRGTDHCELSVSLNGTSGGLSCDFSFFSISISETRMAGATAETYGASLAPGYTGPPQGHGMGGGGAIAAGLEQWWKVTLEPGNYLMTCFVPDPTGKPHLMLGMVKTFTVS